MREKNIDLDSDLNVFILLFSEKLVEYRQVTFQKRYGTQDHLGFCRIKTAYFLCPSRACCNSPWWLGLKQPWWARRQKTLLRRTMLWHWDGRALTSTWLPKLPPRSGLEFLSKQKIEVYFNPIKAMSFALSIGWTQSQFLEHFKIVSGGRN